VDFQSVLSLGHTIFLVADSESAKGIAGYVVAVAVVDEAEILNVAVDPVCGATASAEISSTRRLLR
jgi:hypothetical protein